MLHGLELPLQHRWANSEQIRAAIERARRAERRPRHELAHEPIRTALRTILANWQGTGQRLALEFVAQAVLIA